MEIVILILIVTVASAVAILRTGRVDGDGRGLARWAWALLSLTFTMLVAEFAILDVLFQDGERSFGSVVDAVITGVALTLAVVAPLLSYVFSCLAERRSRRWRDLLPAGVLVGLLALWAVGLASDGSGRWWVPALVGAVGAVGILLSRTVARQRADRGRPVGAHHGTD